MHTIRLAGILLTAMGTSLFGQYVDSTVSVDDQYGALDCNSFSTTGLPAVAECSEQGKIEDGIAISARTSSSTSLNNIRISSEATYSAPTAPLSYYIDIDATGYIQDAIKIGGSGSGFAELTVRIETQNATVLGGQVVSLRATGIDGSPAQCIVSNTTASVTCAVVVPIKFGRLFPIDIYYDSLTEGDGSVSPVINQGKAGISSIKALDSQYKVIQNPTVISQSGATYPH